MSYTIKKVESVEQLKYEFKNGFVDLFDECFNAAPYFLKYSDEELWNMFFNHFKYGFVLFAYDEDGKLVGFAGSRELAKDEYVDNDIKAHFHDIENYWYHSDVGVCKAQRGNGLAQLLLKETIHCIPEGKEIIMRTKEDNEASINLHSKMGFHPLGLKQKGNSNGVENDIRIYMIYEREAS